MNPQYLPKSKPRSAQSLQNCLVDLKRSWRELDKLSQLNENWKTIVGNELSKECKPLKIEHKVLTIAVNHPQWRQALIYHKHRLKDTISRIGISLKEIKIIQNYDEKSINRNFEDPNLVWENHPIRIKKNNIVKCVFCNCPATKGEISRWGKCTFCWRKKV